jgi:hypothetical protein
MYTPYYVDQADPGSCLSKALPNHVDPDVAGASKEKICACGSTEHRGSHQAGNVTGSEYQMEDLRGAARLAEVARQVVCASSPGHVDMGSRIGR